MMESWQDFIDTRRDDPGGSAFTPEPFYRYACLFIRAKVENTPKRRNTELVRWSTIEGRLGSLIKVIHQAHDTILPQPSADTLSQAFSSSAVSWANLKPSTLVTSDAPASTLTPLSLGAIDRPEVSNCPGAFDRLAPLGFLAIAIPIAIIVRTVASDHRAAPSSPQKTTISRFSSLFKARRYGAAGLFPKHQRTGFVSSPYLHHHAPVLAPPPRADDGPPLLPELDQTVDQLPPLLGWNFTTSSTFQDEDGCGVDHDDETWLDAEDNEPLRIKEVVCRIVPFPCRVEDEAEAGEDVAPASTPAPTVHARAREFIPTGEINLNIEFIEPRTTREAIAFPSREDEKHKDLAPTSTPAPTGVPRVQLHRNRAPAAKPNPAIQSLEPRSTQEGILFPSREDENDEDQAIQQGPSFTRPPSPAASHPRTPASMKIALQQVLLITIACVTSARVGAFGFSYKQWKKEGKYMKLQDIKLYRDVKVPGAFEMMVRIKNVKENQGVEPGRRNQNVRSLRNKCKWAISTSVPMLLNIVLRAQRTFILWPFAAFDDFSELLRHLRRSDVCRPFLPVSLLGKSKEVTGKSKEVTKSQESKSEGKKRGRPPRTSVATAKSTTAPSASGSRPPPRPTAITASKKAKKAMRSDKENDSFLLLDDSEFEPDDDSDSELDHYLDDDDESDERPPPKKVKLSHAPPAGKSTNASKARRPLTESGANRRKL
ncbi:hypothetical protein M407DRAFT_235822 [Tulasnella calospora MUT 4182]|uniref:Uncharacterized protein n=1 Tax=Tulasnella calospora MUT 4182 TaxID=1051891 RepID=A0A0C3KXC3_9AGAM|nr:hypothetical protein M407DRAFT_235822 [Tulasnella calospora MUT 4182]